MAQALILVSNFCFDAFPDVKAIPPYWKCLSWTCHDRRNHETMNDEHEDGDPAAAFDALRATVEHMAVGLRQEMAQIRSNVKTALGQFDGLNNPIDYSADLGHMVQNLNDINKRLQAIERLKLLQTSAEHYAYVIERSGEMLVLNAVRQLETQARELQRASLVVASSLPSARQHRQQTWWLTAVAIACFGFGIMFTLFTPRLFPTSAAPRVASVVMADTTWRAGARLMHFTEPQIWGMFRDAHHLIEGNEANKTDVAECRKKVETTQKQQECTIVIPYDPK
ncbi:hypothetical protein IFT84_11305 [Rhizobium sp. CFBP 8762]|uniref:DUF6118 family protein n=1 Tax=Rhizobium sp. CFBP 8762 TaxID=2775279 RepID=UPI001781B1AB|nr:hypothetical protein [Rhizobium sp. CFBP 8762]